MLVVVLFALYLVLFNISDSSGAKELKFVHVLYRHGARAPSRTYPKSKYQADAWPMGWSQLTQVGMQQQYKLGQSIRERYINKGFLNKTYDRNEIYIRSTNKDRALQSASAHLAGLYPPSGFQEWLTGLNWQPIPVHSDTATDQDLLLKPTSVDCKEYDKLEEKNVKEQLAYYNDNFQDFFKYFQNHTGVSAAVDAITVAKYGYSPLSCQLYTNGKMPFPDWVNRKWNGTGSGTLKTVWDVILQIKKVQRISQFSLPKLGKFRGGYLLNDIIQRMNEKSVNPIEDEPHKLMMYSTHQGTLLGLLYAMQVQTGLIPVASCLLFELYKDGQDYTVEVYFRNSSNVEPFVQLEVPVCKDQEKCSLKAFTEGYSSSVFKSRKEWDKACGNKASSLSSFPIIGPITLFFLNLLKRLNSNGI